MERLSPMERKHAERAREMAQRPPSAFYVGVAVHQQVVSGPRLCTRTIEDATIRVLEDWLREAEQRGNPILGSEEGLRVLDRWAGQALRRVYAVCDGFPKPDAAQRKWLLDLLAEEIAGQYRGTRLDKDAAGIDDRGVLLFPGLYTPWRTRVKDPLVVTINENGWTFRLGDRARPVIARDDGKMMYELAEFAIAVNTGKHGDIFSSRST